MLLIFDCDGTLVDSELIALTVLSDLMARHGLPMSVAACLDAFMGKQNDDIVAEMERRLGRTLPPGEGRRMRALMIVRLEAELQPVPGAAEALRQIAGPRCVASSSDPARIALCLEKTGLAPFFGSHIFSAAQVAHGKPAPDLFLLAARSMGFMPQDCIVIEDSVAGVEAGLRAGMHVLGFAGASHVAPDHPERLVAAGAAQVILAMADLPAAIAARRAQAASLCSAS